MTAAYSIGDIATALANRLDGLGTGYELGGRSVTLNGYAEVTGNVDMPAVVVELDTINYDLNMGDGADGLQFVALLLTQAADEVGAQKDLWAFLSRGGGVGLVKAAIEDEPTLGGLVHFAVLTTVRRTGLIPYDGIQYMGAELVIEVVA